MGILKNLVATRTKKANSNTIDNRLDISEDYKENVFKKGYGDSKSSIGTNTILESCLDNLYQGFVEECRQNTAEQQKLNAPLQFRKEKLITELDKRNTVKELKQEEINNNDKRIVEIDNEIAEVRNAPSKYGINVDKKPRVQFYFGILILLPLTLYLIVFYISASYSGFFRELGESSVIPAILDGNAFVKAFEDGWLEGLFVSTLPFVFMGLGYLIHMFQKERKWGGIKITLLIFVTFLFDCILAYLIDKKIYEIDKTLNTPEYNLKVAFTHIDFWGIIFAGFIVYIIWGLVFDFIMKEYDSIDKINTHVKYLKDEKRNLRNTSKKLQENISNVEGDISDLNGKIREIQSQLEGFIFPTKKYRHILSEYMKGWLMAITKEIRLPHKEKEELIQLCKNQCADHLLIHNIENNDLDNTRFYQKSD